MPRSRTALRTFVSSFSKGNSGVWTPMMTRPLSLYFSFHALIYGNVRRQLIQEYVQKSIRTTLPCRDASVRGGELIQAVAPERSAVGDVLAAEPAAAIIALFPDIAGWLPAVIAFEPDIAGLLPPAIIALLGAIIGSLETVG